MTVGGTSILIVVSVVLETFKVIENMVQMRGYEKFLEKFLDIPDTLALKWSMVLSNK
jgi:preprotein translocase subunit SecY